MPTTSSTAARRFCFPTSASTTLLPVAVAMYAEAKHKGSARVAQVSVLLSIFLRKNTFFSKKTCTFAFFVVPLHAFSAFGLQSSAAEGTDDTIFWYANVDDSASRLTDVNN